MQKFFLAFLALVCVNADVLNFVNEVDGTGSGSAASYNSGNPETTGPAKGGFMYSARATGATAGVSSNALTATNTGGWAAAQTAFAFSFPNAVVKSGHAFQITVSATSAGGASDNVIEVRARAYSGGTAGADGACGGTAMGTTSLITSSAANAPSVTITGGLVIGEQCVEVTVQQTAGTDTLQTFTTDDVVLGNWDNVAQPSQTIFGDPHFYPLHKDPKHPYLKYTPKASVIPGVYNVVTHPDLQLNTRWINYPDGLFPDGQYISDGGLLVRNPATGDVARIQVSLVGFGDSATMQVKLNNKLVQHPRTPLFADAPKTTFYIRTFGKKAVEIFTPLIDTKFRVVYREHARATMLEMDTKVENVDSLRDAHGLLGQTAKMTTRLHEPTADELKHNECTRCFMEEDIDSFLVDNNNLFGSKFPLNKFQKN